MEGKKDNSMINLAAEVLPGLLLGFSLGSGLMALFILAWLDRHYPYEKFVLMFIYNFDRILFTFTTAYVVVKLFWLKQKKKYLKKLPLMILCGSFVGFMATIFVAGLGRFDLVNSLWGL